MQLVCLPCALQGHPLSSLCYYLIHTQGLVASCGLDPVLLARCVNSLSWSG